MGIILSMVFWLIAYFAYNSDRKKITPTFIFALVWGVIMFAEGLHLFGLYNSDLMTYCVIATGVISFAAGSLLCRRVTIIRGRNVSDKIKLPLFFVLMMSTILLLVGPAISNASLLFSGELTMKELRRSFDNPYTSTIFRLLYNYIADPFSVACLPIVSVILTTDHAKKIKYTSLFLTVVVMLARILIDAGRGILLYFFVMLSFSYMMFSKESEQKINQKRNRRLLFISGLIAVASYIIVSAFRSEGLSGFGKQVYFYICGCVPFLNGNLQLVDQAQVALFGASGLRGPLQFIFTMLNNIGLMDYPPFMVQSDAWYSSSLAARYIAPSTPFNAYATLFYNVYLDGGLIAVFFEMLFYGAFARCIFNLTEFQPNSHRAKVLYIFVIYGLVFSFIRFQFSLMRNFLCFVFIIAVVGSGRLSNEDCSN